MAPMKPQNDAFKTTLRAFTAGKLSDTTGADTRARWRVVLDAARAMPDWRPRPEPRRRTDALSEPRPLHRPERGCAGQRQARAEKARRECGGRAAGRCDR